MVMSSEAQVLVSNYMYFVGFVVLYFDHACTFTQEVTNVWSRPRLALWFLANRYFAFLAYIPLAIALYNGKSDEHCGTLNLLRQLVLLLSEMLVCALLTMRTFALFGGDRRIIWIAFVWGCVLLGFSGWAIATKGSDSVIMGCNAGLSNSSAAKLSVPWIGLTIWDITIFVLTCFKTKAALRDGPRIPGAIQLPIRTLMLRDGALYFVAMGAANMLNILSFYFFPPFLKGCFVTFASSVSITMMSRLMLNLYNNSRQPQDWELPPQSSGVTNSVPAFAGVASRSVNVTQLEEGW